MRVVVIALVLAVALVAEPHGLSRADRAATVRTLKVMTFNIQHGIDGSHRYNLQRAIDVIASVQPDLVGLQEVTRNHPAYDCDDQPAKLAAGLKAATGRDWSVKYEQEWFTQVFDCRESGRGDGSATEGLAFLAPGPLGATSMTPLPVSRIALAVRFAPAGGLPVVVTHLASGRKNVEARQKEIDALLRWTHRFGPPLILLGDFNAKPDDVELQPVLPLFTDARAAGAAAGGARGQEGTHGDHRIDFADYAQYRLTIVSNSSKLIGLVTVATAPSAWARCSASTAPDMTATGTLATVGSPSCARRNSWPPSRGIFKSSRTRQGVSGSRCRTVRSRWSASRPSSADTA